LGPEGGYDWGGRFWGCGLAVKERWIVVYGWWGLLGKEMRWVVGRRGGESSSRLGVDLGEAVFGAGRGVGCGGGCGGE